MSDEFEIDPLSLGAGTLGLCAMPGRGGDLARDLEKIADFRPDLVLTLVSADEMAAHGASDLPEHLAAAGIGWRHFPVSDFEAPAAEADARWAQLAAEMRDTLDAGGRVVIHCKAGRGRTGAVALRLMLEAGETPEEAMARLRAARPGTVETPAQERWAKAGASSRTAP